MRIIFVTTLLVFIAACTGSKKITGSSNQLNGVWVPVKQYLGGTELPKAAFEMQKLFISDSNYTFTAESTDKGVVTYTGNKMDIYSKEGVNAGKHYTAIYKLENGELSICYNLAGNGYPETFETKGNPLYFFCVFKKE
jgi:uncharacterized protein (TIGR03067 family)